MKNVSLKRLVLENWRAQNRTVDFSDKTIIRGTNGAGKSTITDAFFWLLTGVDTQNRTNYDLYDNTLDFTPENAIPAIVEGCIDVDGTEYTFKRCAKQKWYRPRGKSEYVKDKSDEYTYYIDGLAVSAKAYKDRVEALFGDTEKLKLMLNIRYYQLLDWKARRKHFSDMVGIITDDELKGDYSAIADLMAKYGNTESVKEMLRQKINPLKKAYDSFESEIKGMKAMLPSLEGIEEAKHKRDEIAKRIAEIESSILGLSEANKPLIEKREKQLADIRAKKQELADAEAEWSKEQFSKCKDIQQQIADVDATNAKITKENAQIENQRKSIQYQIEMAQHQAQFQLEELERLREENKAIKARVFDENQVCQSCGQPLPYDKITELKDAFYNKREADHKACVEKGVKTKESLERQNELIESLKKSLEELPQPKSLVSKDELLADLAFANENTIPFEESDMYGILNNQLKLMESQVIEIPKVDSEALLDEKKKLNDEMIELSPILAQENERERGEKRIEKTEAEQAETSVELAHLEGLFDKCVEREREWASIVRDRANKYLKYCKVEMTELSKGGELNDICSVTIDGVDVGVANTARQIVAGIDIAEAFQANAGLNLPVFIDNAEQICDCNIPDIKNQLILTYVDESYPTLNITHE